MKSLKLFVALCAFGSLLFSCSDDDAPTPPNQEELITTLTFTLTPTSGSPVVFSFQDLDGDGGNQPVISTGTLTANTSYSGSIELLNESENPVENVTTEVRDEDEEHQLFYQTSSANLTIDYDDQDGEGNPLGLLTEVTTGAASTGSLTITLRHEPNKNGAGVSGGDITNAGGETDIEVNFDVTIN